MNEVLELGSGGWIRDGRDWVPDRPIYAVLGDPVAHSLSPALQNAAMLERGIETEYLAARVTPGQLRALKEGPAGAHLAGFNATAPLKEAVAALCDGRTDQARALGAVNTVRVEEGRWLGHNTDSGGILTVASQAWPLAAPPVEGVVLGTGGSARAAVDALLRWGVDAIRVLGRSGAGQKRFADWVRTLEGGERVQVGPLDEDPPPPTGPAAWIACLAGGVATRPFLPAAAGGTEALLLDIRYGNQLPAEDRPLGFVFSDGLPVLMMQGGLSFAWWFGPPVPWAAMQGALS